MIDKTLIEFAANNLNIEMRELVEKDILLHLILKELADNSLFKDEFAFKGGTCLAKCYLGYYRFSEDLDFTYIHQEDFKGRSENAIRKILSQKINLILGLLKKISDKLNLDFETDKTNHHYVQYGGSNRFVTFKIWYDSAILNQKTFIKVQINFIEKILFPLIEVKANPIFKGDLAKEIKFIFKEYASLGEPVNIIAYSLNEILIEKVRALITRRGVKARDFVDVYLIQKEIKVNLKSIEKDVIDKVIFMLKYEKYLNSIKTKSEEIEQDFNIGREKDLLLKPLPEDFEIFVEESKPILKDIIRKILEKSIKK